MGTKSSAVTEPLPPIPWQPQPLTPLPEVRELPANSAWVQWDAAQRLLERLFDLRAGATK